MKRILTILIGGICLGLLASASGAGQDEMASLERQFRELPIEARRLTGPLFWLHGDESREQLEAEIAKVAEGGNGCFTAESRPHSDWLGPNWWRDLAICLEAAKKHNLKMWIFDEKWWPSQGIGGKVPPRYAAKRLEAASTEVEGPRSFEADGYGGDRYVAAVAGQVEAASSPKVEAASSRFILGESLVDLAPFIHDGKLAWQVPAGKWRIMKFTHVQAPPLRQNKQLAVDGASKDCVDWFIQTVYQPHYDHFAADFGKTIVGFFYDEPETPGDWGTELNSVLAERKVDWKKAYVAYKFQLAGEEQIAAKYQYLEALADAWGRTMYGGTTQWCHAHGVLSHGHFMEHAGLYHSPNYCAGDMMRLQRYSDMGGIDAVFRQFAMGTRDIQDPPIWQTPKLASSISHVFGKPDDVAMVEIFGGRGQDLTYREMKWWADHMQVSGVNFLIPHSFNPRAPYDDDCPPYFYNGGFEPRWPLYRVWADYTSRLSLMLTGGRHVCPVAILFSGNLGQVGKMVPPEGLSAALQDAQVDCDWLPMDVFERDAIVTLRPVIADAVTGHAAIQLHGERYHVLIVPPVEAIPYATLVKAKEFFDRGGVVIGYGFMPSKSATIGRTKKDVAALCQEIWGNLTDKVVVSRKNAAGGRSYFLPALSLTDVESRVLLQDAGIESPLGQINQQDDPWLHVLHRQKAGRDVFFIANQNHQGGPQQYMFQLTARGEMECWDPMRNEITRPFSRRADENTIYTALTLQPLETVLLVFQPEKIVRPRRIEPETYPIREPIALVRDPNPKPIRLMPEPNRRPVTLSPVAVADPFRGRVTVPADVDLAHARVCLEMDDLPDEAAAVTVNGQRAGGLIGRPLRLDITRHLKPGENTIVIEPLAPKSARLAFYPGADQGVAKPAPTEVTISNVKPRRDVDGNILDAHDGCLQKFGDRYYLYGTGYGKADYVGKNQGYRCYSSPDLVIWKLEGKLLPGRPEGVYYRPYVVYNARTRKYVLWYNWYEKLWDGQYGVATSDRPQGPFTIRDRNVAVARAKPGDLSLLVDDDATAYLIYTSIADHHAISVEKLSDDYLRSTKENSGVLAKGCEAPALVKHGGTYYALFDDCCCACPEGSGVRVYTASKPLGSYNLKQTNVNRDAHGQTVIRAQQTFVARIPTADGLQYVWMGDRWHSAPDGVNGHAFQYWAPLRFDAAGGIEPLKWLDQWTVRPTNRPP